MQGEFIEKIISRLLGWFALHARDLPWRRDYDPYKILVSEFMLQQTQVETVLPYFERWMARYPDLKSLAKAGETDAEKLWEGLGYYSRCRNLLLAARAMAAGGCEQPPPSVEALLKYPGIGPYTAGAVASIAYNVPVPAVDGNVERVAARFFDIEAPTGGSVLKRLVTKKISEMLPENEARSFNQALMELGALVCVPQNPLCPECPWGEFCLARKHGVQALRPQPRARPSVEKIQAWGVLCFTDGFFLLRRRPPSGLWAGFWEIPWFAGKTGSFADVEAWGQDVGLARLSCAKVGVARFSFTSHRVTAQVIACEAELLPPLLEKIQTGNWGLHKLEELSFLTLPAPSRKFLGLLRQRGYKAGSLISFFCGSGSNRTTL